MKAPNAYLATWNVEWCTPGAPRARPILDTLFAGNPDIICLTEATTDLLPHHGHLITSQPGTGYPDPTGGKRRKVLLWSRSRWRDVDDLGHQDMPPGRYVAGATETPIGPLYVRGICIPWSMAHVSTGTRDRTRWQDHRAYLQGLAKLRKAPVSHPEVILGDFNQTAPRSRQPENVYGALSDALGDLHLATRGLQDEEGHAAIDHLAHSPALKAVDLPVLSRFDPGGKKLSDHFGFQARLEPA